MVRRYIWVFSLGSAGFAFTSGRLPKRFECKIAPKNRPPLGKGMFFSKLKNRVWHKGGLGFASAGGLASGVTL